MSSKTVDLCFISELISKDLHLSRQDASNANACRNRSLMDDFIMSTKLYTSGIEYFYSASSAAEGTAVEDSDMDTMMQIRGIEVLNVDNFRPRKSIFFIADSSKSKKGYVRLIPSSKNNKTFHDQLKTDLKELLHECPDGKFVSSEKFRKLMLTYMPDKHTFPDYPYEGIEHGPCVTLQHKSMYDDTQTKPPKVVDLDHAYAIECQWPDEAKEWARRDRKHKWPSPELVNKICKCKCHVVAVGDSSSAAASIEWRQSFLLCEKELIWNFNDTQIQCYVVLKRIVQKYIQPIAPLQISSYNLKTLMFWVAEDGGLASWTQRNLMDCIRACLTSLFECVDNRKLPHYFIRTTNLFINIFLDSSQRKKSVDKIQQIIDNLAYYTLQSGLPSESKLYKLWQNCEHDLLRLQTESAKCIGSSEKFEQSLSLSRKIGISRAKFKLFIRHTANFQSPAHIDLPLFHVNPTMGVDESFAFSVRCYLHVRKGLQYLQQAKSATDEIEKEKFENDALKEIRAGSELDMLSGPLYLATYYLCVGDVKKCFSVVRECIAKLPKRLLYTGFCSGSQGIGSENGKLVQVNQLDVQCDEIERLQTAFDVLFAKEDYSIVPPSLLYACAILPEYGDHYVVIHPCVYAQHLLHYSMFIWEGQNQDTQEVLKQLESSVERLSYSPMNFQAQNILGFSYRLVGRNLEALVAFTLSLQQTTSMPNVRNAAAWFLAIFIYQLISPSSETWSEEAMEKINRFKN